MQDVWLLSRAELLRVAAHSSMSGVLTSWETVAMPALAISTSTPSGWALLAWAAADCDADICIGRNECDEGHTACRTSGVIEGATWAANTGRLAATCRPLHGRRMS